MLGKSFLVLTAAAQLMVTSVFAMNEEDKDDKGKVASKQIGSAPSTSRYIYPGGWDTSPRSAEAEKKLHQFYVDSQQRRAERIWKGDN